MCTSQPALAQLHKWMAASSSGSSEMVEVPADGFLRKTGQPWKVVVAGLVLPIPLALLAYRSLRQIRPEQPTDRAAGSVLTRTDRG